MGNLRILSSAEQVAEHLRHELSNKVWIGMMPGGEKLAKELQVGTNTAEAALKILEKEGWLVNQGRRRGRLIRLKENPSVKIKIRISILLGDHSDRYAPLILELLAALQDAGFAASFAPRTQDDMEDDIERIAQLVDTSSSDVWIIYSGSREVLEWFTQGSRPSFAIAGRANRVQIPSIAPEKITPLRTAIRKLTALGHRRISMLCRPGRRIPEPGLFERAFLEELETLGIQTGSFSLPPWEENVQDFHRMLGSLFSTTPPTALFIDEAPFVTATLQFCAGKGLGTPKDFSLICTDYDPSFDWCQPSITHISWKSEQMIQRILQWTNNVAQGNEDTEKGFSQAEFIGGETVGAAPAS